MRLQIAVILVIVCSVLTFLSRLTGTLYPRLLQTPLFFGIVSLLSFLAFVYFFIIIFIDYAKKEQLLLKIAAVLMIVGSVAIFLLSLKAVLTHFRVFTQLYYYGKPGYLDALVPFINAAFTVFFFSVFLKEIISKSGLLLKLAVILVTVSAFTNFIFKAMVLKKYLLTYDFSWFLSIFVHYQWVIVLMSAFWFITSLFFYIAFYLDNKTNNS